MSLNFKRVFQLMKIDVVTHKKTILLTAITIALALVLFPVHVTSTPSTYFFLLFAGGFIITGFSFKDLHQPQKAHQYLTLPASHLEKWTSKWLLTSVIYAIALFVVYYGFALLGLVVNQFIFNKVLILFNPLTPAIWITICKYIILQSIVLLGAVIFKKNVLIKLALCLGALMFVVSTLTMLFTQLFCPQCNIGGVMQLVTVTMKGAHFLFWVALAPFCWIVSYLRLKEAEI